MSIKVDKLTKIYGDQLAVDQLSFNISKGEVVGFLGPNGAGKTTCMKILSCYIPQTSGKALVCGYDTETHPHEVRSRIGYLPEHNPLYDNLYVREYLELVAGIFKLNDKQKRIAGIIELTGLGVEQHKKIQMLSKGYRQRVGLAQALMHEPDVLILDEPTSGLDPNQLVDIRELIRSVGKEKTVILSSHIMQEIEAVCDRVVIINKGRLVADDPIEELKQRSLGRTKVRIELDREVDVSLLEKIDGIAAARQTGHLTYELWSHAERDMRVEIYNWIKSTDYVLLGMNKVEMSVEEVFQQLTGSS